MKKVCSFLLALSLMLGLAACASSNPNAGEQNSQPTRETEKAPKEAVITPVATPMDEFSKTAEAEGVVIPYAKSIEEEFSNEMKPGIEGNQRAMLHYVDAETVGVEILAQVYYHKEDIEALQPGSLIWVDGYVLEVDHLEDQSEWYVCIVTKNPEEIKYTRLGMSLYTEEDYYYTDMFVNTYQAQIAPAETVAFADGAKMDNNQQDLSAAAFLEKLKNEPEVFSDDNNFIYVEDSKLVAFIDNATGSFTEDGVDLSQMEGLEIPVEEEIPGAVNPFAFVTRGESYSLFDANYFGATYDAELRYVNENQVQADIYRTHYYRAEDIDSLKEGDQVVVKGQVVEVKSFMDKNDPMHFSPDNVVIITTDGDTVYFNKMYEEYLGYALGALQNNYFGPEQELSQSLTLTVPENMTFHIYQNEEMTDYDAAFFMAYLQEHADQFVPGLCNIMVNGDALMDVMLNIYNY